MSTLSEILPSSSSTSKVKKMQTTSYYISCKLWGPLNHSYHASLLYGMFFFLLPCVSSSSSYKKRIPTLGNLTTMSLIPWFLKPGVCIPPLREQKLNLWVQTLMANSLLYLQRDWYNKNIAQCYNTNGCASKQLHFLKNIWDLALFHLKAKARKRLDANDDLHVGLSKKKNLISVSHWWKTTTVPLKMC